MIRTLVRCTQFKRKTNRTKRRKREEIKMMKRELTVDQMNQVNGGYIVDFGMFNNCKVYDDTTGAYLGKAYYVKDAKAIANSFGVSDTLITQQQYFEMFGKRPE